MVTLSAPVPTMWSKVSFPATEIIVNVSVSSMPPVAAPEPLPPLPPQPARPPTPMRARSAAEPPTNCLRETCEVLMSPSFLEPPFGSCYRGASMPRFTQVCQQARDRAPPAGSASLAAVRVERIGETVAQEVEA